jgi:hypothetical protein
MMKERERVHILVHGSQCDETYNTCKSVPR